MGNGEKFGSISLLLSEIIASELSDCCKLNCSRVDLETVVDVGAYILFYVIDFKCNNLKIER